MNQQQALEKEKIIGLIVLVSVLLAGFVMGATAIVKKDNRIAELEETITRQANIIKESSSAVLFFPKDFVKSVLVIKTSTTADVNNESLLMVPMMSTGDYYLNLRNGNQIMFHSEKFTNNKTDEYDKAYYQFP